MRADVQELKKKYGYSDELCLGLNLFLNKSFGFITDKNLDGELRHKKQFEALCLLVDDITKELGYGGAAGGAKSWTGSAWLLFFALLFPDTRWFIAREELKRLRESTLITFFKVAKEYGARKEKDFKYNGQDHYIIFSNESRIDLLEAKELPSDPMFERFGSVEYTGGWIEEAGEISSMAFDVLKTRIGRQNNDKYGILPKFLLTFNPKKNFVYTYFYLRDKENTLPAHIKFVKALLYDNTHRESNYEAQLLAISSVAQKERLLNGNFDYDDNPAVLCDYDAICDMFRNKHVLPDGKRFISADLAMKGRDNFVAGHWDGMIGFIDIVKPKATGKEIEQDLQGLMIKYQVPRSRTVADSDGLGGYLESYLEGIKEFHGGAKAVRDEYVKLKDDCAYMLAEKVNKREIYIICSKEIEDKIKLEMGVLMAGDVDADTKKKQIIKKDEMKKLISCSPDYLDMLIMRMYFEVQHPEPVNYVDRS